MKKLFFIILMFTFIFTGCSSLQQSHLIQKQKLKPNQAEDVIDMHGRVTNFDKFDHFVTNTTIGIKDNVRIVRYTIEADPIIYDLSYNKNTIKLVYDNSYDSYGPRDKGKKESFWAGIDKEHKEDYIEYYLYQVSDKPQEPDNLQNGKLNFRTKERMPVLTLKDSLNKTGQTAIILEDTVIKERPSENSKTLSSKLFKGNLVKILDDKGQGWYYIEPIAFSYPVEKGYINDKYFSFDINKSIPNQGFINRKHIYSNPHSNISNQEYGGPVTIIRKENGWVFCSFHSGIENAWVKESDIEYQFPK